MSTSLQNRIKGSDLKVYLCIDGMWDGHMDLGDCIGEFEFTKHLTMLRVYRKTIQTFLIIIDGEYEKTTSNTYYVGMIWSMENRAITSVKIDKSGLGDIINRNPKFRWLDLVDPEYRIHVFNGKLDNMSLKKTLSMEITYQTIKKDDMKQQYHIICDIPHMVIQTMKSDSWSKEVEIRFTFEKQIMLYYDVSTESFVIYWNNMDFVMSYIDMKTDIIYCQSYNTKKVEGGIRIVDITCSHDFIKKDMLDFFKKHVPPLQTDKTATTTLQIYKSLQNQILGGYPIFDEITKDDINNLTSKMSKLVISPVKLLVDIPPDLWMEILGYINGGDMFVTWTVLHRNVMLKTIMESPLIMNQIHNFRVNALPRTKYDHSSNPMVPIRLYHQVSDIETLCNSLHPTIFKIKQSMSIRFGYQTNSKMIYGLLYLFRYLKRITINIGDHVNNDHRFQLRRDQSVDRKYIMYLKQNKFIDRIESINELEDGIFDLKNIVLKCDVRSKQHQTVLDIGFIHGLNITTLEIFDLITTIKDIGSLEGNVNSLRIENGVLMISSAYIHRFNIKEFTLSNSNILSQPSKMVQIIPKTILCKVIDSTFVLDANIENLYLKGQCHLHNMIRYTSIGVLYISSKLPTTTDPEMLKRFIRSANVIYATRNLEESEFNLILNTIQNGVLYFDDSGEIESNLIKSKYISEKTNQIMSEPPTEVKLKLKTEIQAQEKLFEFKKAFETMAQQHILSKEEIQKNDGPETPWTPNFVNLETTGFSHAFDEYELKSGRNTQKLIRIDRVKDK